MAAFPPPSGTKRKASNEDFDVYGTGDIDWGMVGESVAQLESKKPRTTTSGRPNTSATLKTVTEHRSAGVDNVALQSNIVPSHSALRSTLEKYFGYKGFREGQLDCIGALMGGKDVAVFWATGRGKSLVYQLPALHRKTITLVVSPLISLMVDQVKQLNSLTPVDIACYLGSAQMNPLIERKALNGEFLLVYLTPEKIAASSFLEKMRGKVGFVAIDEAHCVSEWGHDFRKDYRNLSVVRQRLPGVPLCLLTATAGKQVQEDILNNLGLQRQHTFISKSSFDRTNLRISIRTKSLDGIRADFAPMVSRWNGAPESAVVYCPTRGDVEKVAVYLGNSSVLGSGVVAKYHGGMTSEDRREAHLGFLSGQYKVIVATIAFGMGIDKPDIRCVVHYGTPKTMEEYYQHIGRGGRDGLDASCTMFYSPSDFVRYKSAFYTKNKTAKAIEMANKSGDILRNFVEDRVVCRRFQILQYFNETPAFGSRCGNCDNCLDGRDGSRAPTTRDFAGHAQIIFEAIKRLGSSSLTKTGITKTISEILRNNPSRRSALPGSVSSEMFASLLPSLVRAQYLGRSTKQNDYMAYEVYQLTAKGRRALTMGGREKVMLPIPDVVVELERKAQERVEQTKRELVESGIDITMVPLVELNAGKGPILNAYTNWLYRLKSLRSRGNEKLAAAYEELLKRIEVWRAKTSVQFEMAPHNVMPGYLMRQIAYVKPTSKEALESIGVRIRTIGELAEIMAKSVDELFSLVPATKPSNAGLPMAFPEHSFQPTKPWLFAKEGKGAHRSSYERFQKGEMVEAIALHREDGKSISPATVISHVLKALMLGNPVNLKRLASFTTPPTENEWDCIEIASNSAGNDVVATEKFQMGTLMPFIVGEEKAAVGYKDRSEALRAEMSHWYGKIKWWMHLKRAGFVPQFEVWKRKD